MKNVSDKRIDPRLRATTPARVCAPRKRFATLGQARAVSASIASKSGEHRLPESCHWCNGWHLAEADPRSSVPANGGVK